MIASSISRRDQAMERTRINFPVELLVPYKYKSGEGVPSVCNVLIVRTIETATVVLSEMPNNSERSLADYFELAATQLYTERLKDMPAWRIRWYTHSPVRGGHMETIHTVTLEWVISASPDGGFCFKCTHWRALRSSEVLVLLQDIDNDIRRFGVSGGINVVPKLSVLRTEPRQARDGIDTPAAVEDGHPQGTISAAIDALGIAQRAAVHGDLLRCYSSIRMAHEKLLDAKFQIDSAAHVRPTSKT